MHLIQITQSSIQNINAPIFCSEWSIVEFGTAAFSDYELDQLDKKGLVLHELDFNHPRHSSIPKWQNMKIYL